MPRTEDRIEFKRDRKGKLREIKEESRSAKERHSWDRCAGARPVDTEREV